MSSFSGAEPPLLVMDEEWVGSYSFKPIVRRDDTVFFASQAIAPCPRLLPLANNVPHATMVIAGFSDGEVRSSMIG